LNRGRYINDGKVINFDLGVSLKKGLLKQKKYQLKWLKIFNLSVAIVMPLIISPLKTLAQSELPSEVNIPSNTSDPIERTAPRPNRPLPSEIPKSKPQPNLQIPDTSQPSECINSKRDLFNNQEGELFYVRDVRVTGNTVLQTEIDAKIKQFKRRTVTFDDLICLRSQITKLYLNNGYITSGAFLPNNQNLNSGIITLQVVEGGISDIAIKGLKRLKPGYVRSRLKSATSKPLNRQNLEKALQLLLQDPLIARVDGKLAKSTTSGDNILLLSIQEADAFSVGVGADNYRSPSIGESQLSTVISHNNVFGFGDRISADYNLTEGLDLYNISYTIPWNAKDGTFSVSYDNSDSNIVAEEFEEVDIESESESFTVGLRQPVVKTPNTEVALGFDLNLLRRQTFLDDRPFSFTVGLTDNMSKATALRFSQEWVNRQPKRVLAARSQFSLGIDAFDATITDTGTDGRFFAWQAQFQWVEQLSQQVLLVTRFGSQITLDSLLSFEKFGMGGVNTIRGYPENRMVTDNGVLGSLELRIPVTSDPETLQLTPFAEIGGGWNNEEPDSDINTLASLGLGLRWSINPNFRLRLDYGVPLVNTGDEGDSLQDNGLHWSLNYQAF
jgi:hemolysin activation/secretion protein